jgi:hypothetical protein
LKTLYAERAGLHIDLTADGYLIGTVRVDRLVALARVHEVDLVRLPAASS